MKFRFALIILSIFVFLLVFLSSCGECEHEFSQWKTVKPATCVDKGTKIAQCSLCSLSKTETIDKVAHSIIKLDSIAPSCSQTGLSEGTRCSVCNKILTVQEVLQKTEHIPTVIKGRSPSCVAYGLTDGIGCEKCGEVLLKQEQILKTEHSFSDNKCTVCGTAFFTEGLQFTLNAEKSSYKVSLGDCKDDAIVIPNEYKGLPVTFIEASAFNNGTFTEIVIPSSVLTIEMGAFKGCSSLQKVTIPFVGKSADAKGKEALFGYIFGDSNYDGSYKASQTYSSLYAKSYYIPNSIKEVVLTGGLTYGAFDDCANISSIIIPSHITAIPSFCFRGCTSLLELPINDSIATIGKEAYRLCESATCINVPASVTEINDFAFAECYSLSNINVHSDNKIYKSVDGCLYSKNGELFICYALGKDSRIFSLDETVLKISGHAFYNAKNLDEVILNKKLVSIDDSAFKASSLKKIHITECVTTIGASAFFSCKELSEITFSNYLKTIGSFAFQKCSSLKSITLPKGIELIDSYAFSSCPNLTSIYLPASVTEIGKNAFWESYNATIYCEDANAGTNWHEKWNSSNCPVVWSTAKNE